MDNGLMDWINQQVMGVRNNFRKMRGQPSVEEEEQGKMISPIPDDQMLSNQPPSFEHASPEAMKSMQFQGQAPNMEEFSPAGAAPQQPQQPIVPQAEAAAPEPSPTMSEFSDTSQYRESGNFEIKPLPDSISQEVQDTFGKEAGRAAVVMGTENPEYDPTATYQNKGDAGQDTGLFQINSKTLEDFIRRKPKQVHEIGVTSVEDLKDPIKNIRMAKIIFSEQGWKAWYAPRDKGYNVYD